MTTPRFSVIESTTPRLSFAEDLAVYAKAGVDGIGIWESKLGDDREDLARLRDSGLKTASCFLGTSSILPSPFNPGSRDPAVRIADQCRSIQRLAAFEPSCCFMVSGPRGTLSPEEARQIVVGGLRTLAPLAADAGMTLALELMHPSLAESFGFIHTIDDALDLLDEVDQPNAAIALDVWHFVETPELFVQLREHTSRFASLHINDRRDPSRSWCDRVLPGDGVSDIPHILGCLDEGGFDRWYELEILSDDGSYEQEFPDSLWKRDPLEVVTAGRTQFLAAWEARHGEPA